MSDENVSAEEARGHVGAWYPPVDGAAACYQVPRLARTVIALHDRVAEVEAERDEARRMLHREQENAAARERVLSRRVDALRASERATNEARRERDRLARILAVERGDESQAPEGWRVGASGWFAYGEDPGQCDREVMREDLTEPWLWVVYSDDGPAIKQGNAPSYLEAMDAADTARGEVTDGQ